ncbi:MAG: chromate transporter [Clostridium sp.]
MKELLAIYIAFFKMGGVTFGGGYAMLPILRRECVEKRHWITEEQVMDYYAISQGLPGIIAVNVSVFIGYRLKKVSGGIAAALGCVSPSIIIISIIAEFLSNFQDNLIIRHAMAGISICVVALILDSVIGLWKKGVKDIWGLFICVAVFAITEFTSISPMFVILAAGILGIVLKSIKLSGDKEVSK